MYCQESISAFLYWHWFPIFGRLCNHLFIYYISLLIYLYKNNYNFFMFQLFEISFKYGFLSRVRILFQWNFYHNNWNLFFEPFCKHLLPFKSQELRKVSCAWKDAPEALKVDAYAHLFLKKIIEMPFTR